MAGYNVLHSTSTVQYLYFSQASIRKRGFAKHNYGTNPPLVFLDTPSLGQVPYLVQWCIQIICASKPKAPHPVTSRTQLSHFASKQSSIIFF